MNARVSIVGNIGCGKSTLISSLETQGYNVFYEPVHKWYALKLFYDNIPKWAFALQIQILDSFHDVAKSNIVVERSPWESLNVFAKHLVDNNLMSSVEMDILKSVHSKMGWMPDIFIYIKTKPEKCIQRIKKRNRECESNIEDQYIKDLHDLYEHNMMSLECSGHTIYTIDGNREQNEVYNTVISVLKDNNFT